MENVSLDKLDHHAPPEALSFDSIAQASVRGQVNGGKSTLRIIDMWSWGYNRASNTENQIPLLSAHMSFKPASVPHLH